MIRAITDAGTARAGNRPRRSAPDDPVSRAGPHGARRAIDAGMRSLLVTSLFAVTLIAIAAGCSVEAEEESAASEEELTKCKADVNLHVRADTFFPRPDEYEGSVRNNGCWRFERPRQASWGMCDTAAPFVKKMPAANEWFYDEIWQPRHGGQDLEAIRKCASTFGIGKGTAYAVWTGSGGFGDVGCAPGNICLPDGNGKRVDISPWIDRVWLETYTDASMAYYRSHRSLGRPIIDITHMDDPYPAVKKLCESEKSSKLPIGIYVGPAANGKYTKTSPQMGRLIRAMNECTGPANGPPKAAPPATEAPEPPPPPDAPASGSACAVPQAKTCLDGDRFIECTGGKWSHPYSCNASWPGMTCRSGYCVGQ